MNSFNSKFNADSTTASNIDDDLKYGFLRPDMYKSTLAGTVGAYDRHVFLCYKTPDDWPASVEDPELDPIPRLLASALKSRKNHINGKIRLTLCEGGDGTESSNGDILIFPDMIRYRGLTCLDVDNFVENVFVMGSQWASVVPEMLTGSYVFVCCHQNRDMRCGLCGPVLVERFKEEIELQTMKHQVFVSPCSHLGGHQYAGNLIIFGPRLEGKCEGHWYGYVTPNDVPILLDEHIQKGKIVEQLWRGQMGLLNGEGKKFEEPKLQQNSTVLCLNENNMKNGRNNSIGSTNKGNTINEANCCCGADRVSCCGNKMVEENTSIEEKNTREGIRTKGLGRL